MASTIKHFFLTLSLAALLLVQLPGEANAVDLRHIDQTLSSLPFAGNVNDVTNWVGSRIERDWAARISKSVDDDERGKLKAQSERAVFEFRQSQVAFDGRRTGFEVSLIAGEYLVGSGESLLTHIDADGKHYFFMINGKLWKYARQLRPTTPFTDRVANLSQYFGTPAETKMTKRFRKDPAMTVAIWTDKLRRVRVWDRRTLYGADLLVIEHRPVADRITDLRGGKRPATARSGVDPDLADFLLDEGVDEEDLLTPDSEKKDRKKGKAGVIEVKSPK